LRESENKMKWIDTSVSDVIQSHHADLNKIGDATLILASNGEWVLWLNGYNIAHFSSVLPVETVFEKANERLKYVIGSIVRDLI
jgi:hypothetical protein